MELQPGTLFNDRYRLIREISRGSFGEVWLAQDERLDLEVAVKVYIALDSRGIEEFKTEYKVAYTLNHPNLLHAHHFDVCGNRPFLVMPFCPSSAVAHIGQTDEQTAWRFIRDVAAGLDFLHGQNIVHRDIKPDNILCDAEGHFLITDFGISVKMKSTLRRNSTRKLESNAAGTIGYMAPELFSSNPDAVMATDIWALGASLYEMITGELPFMGQGGVMQLHGAEVPELKGDFSLALKDTLAACLAKETWDRPTADRLHEFAKAVIGGENPSATWFKTAATKQQWSKSTVKTSRRTVKQNAPKPLPADPNATRPVGEQSQKLLRQNDSDRKIWILLLVSIGILVFNQLIRLFSYEYPILPQWEHVFRHGYGETILILPALAALVLLTARAVLFCMIFRKSKTPLQKISAATIAISIIYDVIITIWLNASKETLGNEILGLRFPTWLWAVSFILMQIRTLGICTLIWCTGKNIAAKITAGIYLLLLLADLVNHDISILYYVTVHSIALISMVIIYKIYMKSAMLPKQ